MRFIWLLIITLTGLSLQAQTAFSVDTAFVSVSYAANEPVFYPWITLTNNTAAPLQMRCVKISDQKPSGWETWLEDLDSAYTYVPDTSTFMLSTDTLAANHLIVSFHPHGVVGRSTVVLKLYPANDPADSVLLTFQGNAYRVDTTGIAGAGLWMQGISLYPQPTQGMLQISGVGAGQIKRLQVMDITGKTMDLPWQEAFGIIVVQAHNLPRGIYVLLLQDGQGRGVARRFVRD